MQINGIDGRLPVTVTFTLCRTSPTPSITMKLPHAVSFSSLLLFLVDVVAASGLDQHQAVLEPYQVEDIQYGDSDHYVDTEDGKAREDAHESAEESPVDTIIIPSLTIPTTTSSQITASFTFEFGTHIPVMATKTVTQTVTSTQTPSATCTFPPIDPLSSPTWLINSGGEIYALPARPDASSPTNSSLTMRFPRDSKNIYSLAYSLKTCPLRAFLLRYFISHSSPRRVMIHEVVRGSPRVLMLEADKAGQWTEVRRPVAVWEGVESMLIGLMISVSFEAEEGQPEVVEVKISGMVLEEMEWEACQDMMENGWS